MNYKPSPVPSNIAPALQEFLARELRRIAQSFDTTQQDARKESSSKAFFLGNH